MGNKIEMKQSNKEVHRQSYRSKMKVTPLLRLMQMLMHLRVGEKEPLSIMRGLVGGLGPLQQIFNKYFKQDNKYLLEVCCWTKDEQQSQKSSLICFMKWEIWPSAK